MSAVVDHRELAVLAVTQALHAVVSLNHLAAEGEHDDNPNVVELLADALKLAIEAGAPSENGLDDVNQLHGAATKFLDGWAG